MSQGIYTLLRFLQYHAPGNSSLEPFQRLDRWAEPADRPWLRSLLAPGMLLAPFQTLNLYLTLDIMSPMPLLPPVTTATRPLTLNRSEVFREAILPLVKVRQLAVIFKHDIYRCVAINVGKATRDFALSGGPKSQSSKLGVSGPSFRPVKAKLSDTSLQIGPLIYYWSGLRCSKVTRISPQRP